MRKLKKTEPIVYKYFTEICKFHVDVLEEGSIPNQKSPDFSISTNDKLKFYCEVKSLNPITLESEPLCEHTINNAISRNIDESVKKFIAVNKSREYPNVIAWTSKEMRYTINDIIDFCNKASYSDKNEKLYDLSPRYYHLQRDKNISMIDAHLYFDERDIEPNCSIYICSRIESFRVRLSQIFSKFAESIGYVTIDSKFGNIPLL